MSSRCDSSTRGSASTPPVRTLPEVATDPHLDLAALLACDVRGLGTADTIANLGSQGITGLKYIDLTRGTSGARVRKPGEEIPAGTSLFDSLALQAGQIATKVEAVLDRLSERQRRVLILFELEGMSTPDIAALIGARVGTVRVWLYRARAAFLEHHEAIAAGERNWEDRK